MAVKNYVQAIDLASINSNTFAGAYLPINALGLPQACFLIRIINNSTSAITISYDGVHDHDFLPAIAVAGSPPILQLPFQANSQPNNFTANLSVGTKIYIKGAAGAGLVYLAGYFQPKELI